MYVRRPPLYVLQAPRDGAGGCSGKVGYDRVLRPLSKDQHANSNYLTISERAAERLVSWAFASGLWLAFSPDSLTRAPDPCLRVRTCQVCAECFILLLFGTFVNTEQPPDGLLMGENAPGLQHCMQHVLGIVLIAVATAARTRATRRAMRRQESMTVGGFWAASDNKWVGD